ncbi:amidohydrolase family protein [Marispirochaeta aestuarii]|uniref:amidohydrolase family protein n=1 Tax=Marispirochaeta aestuarii TaxID=1963862 RepID=UPI0029C7BF84|nr:amidohydrolase family protein [Marispirochaeta aestuarii]
MSMDVPMHMWPRHGSTAGMQRRSWPGRRNFPLSGASATNRVALKLGEKFPETLIILNHTGLPSDRRPERLSAWSSAMKTFAQFPNAMVKISGLGLPGKPWLLEDNRGVILDTLEIFGLERCMFASNFPEDSLVGDFDTVFSGFLEAVRDLDPGEKRKLFVENALRICRIDAWSSGRGA